MILSIDVTFTAGHFHGDEWPPAPARLFQALIAATYRGVHGLIHTDLRDHALKWLENLAAPVIIAPRAKPRRDHLIHYVPNNDDGETGDILDHVRAAKSLRVYPLPPDSVVTYLWNFPLTEDDAKHADCVAAMTSLVTQLGRTVDLVYARGEVIEHLAVRQGDTREVMRPQEVEGGGWLSPKAGFLALCKRRYPRSVSEMPPDFTNSRQVNYGEQAIEEADLPSGLFELRRMDDLRLSYDPRRLREPSGMVRHAFQLWLQKNPRIEKRYGADRIARVLFGHRTSTDATPSDGGHVAIVTLPSVNANFTADGLIRRVLLLGFGLKDETDRSLFSDLRRGLDGILLQDERGSSGHPNEMPDNISGARGYLRRVPEAEEPKTLAPWMNIDGSAARVWRSSTPIILTGHMRSGRSAEKCLYRTLAQQGIAADLIASIATFTGPIVPKSVVAREYRVRGYLNNTRRLHAEIVFREPIKGPLVVGRGRFVGFGLMLPWSIEDPLSPEISTI